MYLNHIKIFVTLRTYHMAKVICSYSRVPNKRPPRLLNFPNFSTPPALIPTPPPPPPLINFSKSQLRQQQKSNPEV